MDILTLLLFFIPLVLVLWLANFSHRKRIEGEAQSERVFKLLAYGLLFLLYGGLILLGAIVQVAGMVAQTGLGSDLEVALAASGVPEDALARVGLALWAPSLVGLALLTRPARRLAARFTAIDPSNPVHAVALALIPLILVNLLATLGLGLGNLAEMMEAGAAAGAEFNPLPSVWIQNIVFVLMALIGVGLLARRTLPGALNRLGIVAPTVPQAILGVVAGVVMAPAIILIEYGVSLIGLGADPDVARLTEQLIGPLTTSAVGILTLGLAAALGEESIFRGALQLRFGLLLTTLLFALLHSQYGFTFSTVAVFGVGLVLGLLRLRANTTTAMITHAVYNMSLGLIAYFGWLQNL